MPQRRLSPPWTVEEHTAYFIVKDHTGLNLAYVYFESAPGCRPAAKLLSRVEASRIAIKIASLPELIVEKTIVRARPKK
jgi:hypothetical protein